MRCPKCKEGDLEEDYFNRDMGICDKCNTVFMARGKKKSE